ncbi:MAG: heparinase [Armatimonadetes bacterium]|nr:heparinase [Armatimonadota bacterium]
MPTNLFVVLPVLASGAAAQEAIPPARVADIAPMLPVHPAGVGKPITDRATWDALAQQDAFKSYVSRAETLLTEPLPDQPDDLFLDFSRTGNRDRWQRVAGQRRERVTVLTLAECVENQGRFIQALEETVAALCAERTWVMPAHDGSLANFEAKTIDIDLASSAVAWNLATADYLLGDRLSPEMRTLVRDNVRRRALDPYLAMVRGERSPNWWMLTTNNWNAVCLAGVTGAALAQAESPEERALFVAAAEQYSLNFLQGFTADGYCSEGLGYWNYGFGHYVLLAETICQATKGGVDLFVREEVKAPAAFGARIEIINGVYPAFADCGISAQPDYDTMWFVNRRYALGLRGYDTQPLGGGSLFDAMLCSLPNSASALPLPPPSLAGTGPRSWFDRAGILISRPGASPTCRLGVALKGGHNAEHHNHNDVGSYVVVVGQRAPLLDPGSERYTARTFSAKRYESNVLNSFGHPVPVIAGKLQRAGREAQAKVLQADFNDAADTLKLDIRSAYDVPELQTLERTFVYSREGAGSLTVTDHVVYTQPQTFATALITCGSFREASPGELNVYDFDEALRVRIEASGEYEIQAEEIHEDTSRVPTRIGLNLTQPVSDATITFTITPLDLAAESGSLVPNGSFEHGAFKWRIGDKMSTISDEQAHTGTHSLKIVDPETEGGSNVSSVRIPVDAAGKYELKGWVHPVSGDGVGLYVKYWSADNKQLNPTDERGWISGIGSVGGDTKAWKPFSFPFDAPEGTKYLQIWIHSANAAQVEAYVDDLDIVKAG